jgi:hypothetical protein
MNLVLILFRLGVIGFIFLLLIIDFISYLKYIFLLLISLFFILVLNLKSSESILINYCERKKIKSVYEIDKKYFILYSFIIIIMSLYICYIDSRLFIIINNLFNLF